MASPTKISFSPQTTSSIKQKSVALVPRHNNVPSTIQPNFSYGIGKETYLTKISVKSNVRDDFQPKKSWRAPIIMLSTFFIAVILSVVHDSMNRALNGTTVSLNGPWSQQWTSRHATALAFLIKMLFVTSVGTAFVQRQWLNLSTYRQAIRIRSLDVLSNALSTPFSLFSSPIWWQHPVLLTIAVIFWTLPLAAIITPGTLSIESQPHTYTTTRTALRLTKQLNRIGLEQGYEPDNQSYPLKIYIQETPQLAKIAYAVATSSQIAPIKSDFANQTYFTNFVGPALKCEDASSTVSAAAINTTSQFGNISYVAWISNFALNSTNSKKPSFANSNFSQLFFYSSAPDVLYGDGMGNEMMGNEMIGNNTLWIVTRNTTLAPSGSTTINGTTAHIFNGTERNSTAPYIVKECQLWNASYGVEFTYQNFQQTTTIHNLTYQNLIPSISSSGTLDSLIPHMSSTLVARAVLSALGSIVVGARFPESNINLLDINVFDSAQLGEGMEEVFMNITLSLFSVPKFLANTTDTIPTNVTLWSNTYVYQQRNLLLAYGFSFLVSLICCIFGMHSFYRNGGSFQNSFSTYIRAAEASDLDIRDLVSPGDTGADPLPRDIGEKTIIMASRKTH